MLQVDNLYLELDGKPIINGLDLHVKRGEIHGVLGENGTGKTSLAYVIMGVNGYKATSGKILVKLLTVFSKQGINILIRELVLPENTLQ